jgi:mono/diheme cytochrome c family protein
MRNLAILVLLSFQCVAQNQLAPNVGEKLFLAHCAVCHVVCVKQNADYQECAGHA